MTDPLSVSASIAGLITLAEIIFRRTHTYVKAVKDASKDISALSSEVGSLYGVLQSLHLVSSQLEDEAFESTTRIHHVNSCHQTLEKIRVKLQHIETTSVKDQRLQTIKRKLKWPFSSSEVKDLIAELERHKQTLSLALHADSMSGMLQALSMQRDIRGTVEDMKTLMKDRHEAETRVAMSKDRQRVLESFRKVDPRKSHDMSRKLRHPGTGLWLTESSEFQDWLTAENARLWLYGIPGAGKTVLAASVIDEALQISSPSIAVAFFYCDYKDSQTQDIRRILGSLAEQIAKQDEQSFEKLHKFYETYNPDQREDVLYDPEKTYDLILDMISSFDCTMIIVDALDECGVNMGRVVDVLAGLSDGEDTNVKTLFLSRDEYEIRQCLEAYTQIPIAARSGDLRLYVGAEIEVRMRKNRLRIKDNSLKEYIMEQLIEGAEGMFRWVTCQMDYLCELPNDAARRKALHSLPPDLNSTYERILRRVNSSTVETQKLVQRTLRWILHGLSYDELQIDALCEAISIEMGDTRINAEAISDEVDILRWCSSLVRKSADGDHLELAHFTVKEFLLQIDRTKHGELAAYALDREHDEIELAKVCLTYLNFDVFDQRGAASLESKDRRFQLNPFRRHAVLAWAEYARDHLDDNELLSLAGKLFHPSKPNTFVSWAYDRLLDEVNRTEICGEWDQNIISSCIAEANALHFAALEALPKLCSWLIEHGCDVNRNSAFGTPLHCALSGWRNVGGKLGIMPGPFFSTSAGDVETVKLLLAAKADPNILYEAPRGQLSALFVAMRDLDLPIALQMLEGGAFLDNDCLDLLEDEYRWNGQALHAILGHITNENTQLGHRERLMRLAVRAGDPNSIASANERDCKWKIRSLQSSFPEPTLRVAAEFGQLETISRLLNDYSHDIDSAHEDTGLTALHYAARNDHLQVVEALLARGANPSRPDCKGRTALHHSASGKGDHCLSLFLQQDLEIGCTDHEGLNILHLASQIDNRHSLDIVLGHCPTCLDLNGRSLDGKTALMFAADSGNASGVKSLLLHGCDVTIVDKKGWTVAHYAVSSGQRKVIAALRDTGLDWNSQASAVINSLQRQNVTPLHLAASLHYSSVLEYLLCENLVANIDGVTDYGETALFVAVWSGFSKNASLLLSHGADAKIMDKHNGESPIHLAARCGDRAMVSEILDHKCDIITPDRDGLSPEIIARKYGYDDLAELLRRYAYHQDPEITDGLRKADLSATEHTSEALKVAIDLGDLKLCRRIIDGGADVDFVYDYCPGCTPLLYALHQGQPAIGEYLILQGASITGITCHNGEARGYTAFHYASSRGWAGVLRVLLEKAPTKFLELNDPIHPIHLAVANGHDVCVKSLIDAVSIEGKRYLCHHNGTNDLSLADLVNLSVDGDKIHWPWSLRSGLQFPEYFYSATPLHIAASYGHIEIAKLLIHHGAAVDCLDSDCQTPLHFAAEDGQPVMIDLLLEAGANPNAVDFRLRSPCMLAASEDHLSCFQKLVKGGADLRLRDMWHHDTLRHATVADAVRVSTFLMNRTHRRELYIEDGLAISGLSRVLRLMPSFALNLAPSPSAYLPQKGNLLSNTVLGLNKKHFRMLLRRLPQELIPVLLSHRALYQGTPLYAAAVGAKREDRIVILLDVGADIELEGGDHGTALMGACAAGRLKAVKILIAKGARTSYTKDGETISALRAAKYHPQVIRWLLVGRFEESPRLITLNSDSP